ncbi:ABC transporter ATP-binding protein [Roseobacter sp. EG26]|uniref:ABC transporter ATP-binding protein n=1 Tax=Roseobacter sp. EG26 TaxID=3412477 RepID=UPI003CE48F63
MLELKGLSKTFGGVQAVRDVTLHMAAREVRGLIGPNGAGKTTLINLISGILAHNAGSLSLDGRSLDGKKADQRAGLGISRTFQNLRVFPNLSVAQNIDVGRYTAARAGRDTRALVEAAISEFDLTERLVEPAQSLSYGHQRRLEIVRALATGPKLLMLDEPAAGMNEKETEALGKSLAWVRGQSDTAIMVIDHDLKFIMSLCDEVTVMNMGAVIADGSPDEITKNPQVIDAYLGEDHEDAA